MEWLKYLFGVESDLNALQMSCRGVLIFFISLVLIRISGRRSFGMRTPLDNIIVILLGAILARAVIGVSPFIPVICTCTVIVLLHRLLGRLIVDSPTLSKLIEGERILLYQDGQFIDKNLKRGLVSQKDILQGVRKNSLNEDISDIKAVFLERNGEISVIEKDKNTPS